MPLTIAVRFLTGYCVAARSKIDTEPEWPPHPARLFMALAAAWFESDRDGTFRWLDIASTLQLTAGLRRAIQANVEEISGGVPEVISGHKPDGYPTDRPHIAYIPLPFVRDEHGDGHLLGFAVVLPREQTQENPGGIGSQDVKLVMAALGLLVNRGLKLGRLGDWKVDEDTELRQHGALLRPDSWTSAAEGTTTWASVTPVAFDEHPRARERLAYHHEATELVSQMFVRIGLPPARVALSSISRFTGAPPARDFPRLTRKDGSERRHVHIVAEFDQKVVGPIIIGAGRYRGYGLLKPIPKGGGS